jgi:hypothetical protein
LVVEREGGGGGKRKVAVDSEGVIKGVRAGRGENKVVVGVA